MRVQPVVGSFYQAEKADKNIPTTTGQQGVCEVFNYKDLTDVVFIYE
jgi:hypothetical protein